MKNDKEEKSKFQPGPSDNEQAQRTSETARQASVADLARSRDIFTGLMRGAPKAWESIEPTTLGEQFPQALARKRDIFTGLMRGAPKAWESIEPTVLQTRGGHRSNNQVPRRPGATTDPAPQAGSPGATRKKS